MLRRPELTEVKVEPTTLRVTAIRAIPIFCCYGFDFISGESPRHIGQGDLV